MSNSSCSLCTKSLGIGLVEVAWLPLDRPLRILTRGLWFPASKVVNDGPQVLDEDGVLGVEEVVHEQVVLEAQVQPLPEVNLVNEALITPRRPGVGLDNARGLQIQQIQKLLLVCQTFCCMGITLF